MEIKKRVELYKSLFGENCKALEAVKGFILPVDRLEALEAIRGLNTELSNLYMVSLPTLTVWVRDDNYVAATGEIYLTEPELEGFLHQFRHHLQNVERKYERRGLTTEGKLELAGIPYKDTVYKMYGEDDAIAWSKFVIELSSK
jgi:hypothetical protein|nr:MAG TPA: hypothetical protein [Caudoviricetes sp.]